MHLRVSTIIQIRLNHIQNTAIQFGNSNIQFGNRILHSLQPIH